MRDMSMACLLVAAVGCGGTPRVVQYAQPLPRRLPPIIRLESPSAPWKRDPLDMVDNNVLSDRAKEAAAKDPHAVIAAGNVESDTVPEDGDADGNTMVYQYSLDRTFHVYGCFGEDIDVMFADGEQIVEAVGKKDERQKRLASGWSHSFIIAGDDKGHLVEVLVIRPIEQYDGLRKLKIHTSIGPYTFMLEVLPRNERRCMDKVRFVHPQRELDRAIQADRRVQDDQEDGVLKSIGCNSLNYSIEVLEGSPVWVPTKVGRSCVGDHAIITIQFPNSVGWGSVPAFKCNGGACNYRYISEDHSMVVDGLFTTANLWLGSDETGYEKVKIQALKDPR